MNPEFHIFLADRDLESDTVARDFFRILSSKRAKKLYLFLGALIVLILLGDNVVMPWFVSRGGTVEVPGVVGLRFERAQAVLDSLGLQARQSEVRPDLKYPLGTVVGQVPNMGSKVRAGRRVYLAISGGEPVVDVPTLKGRSLRDAKFTLERMGLALGSTTYVPSEEFPPNTVVDQGSEPGARIRQGSAISVVISQGKVTDRITVPELLGKILPEAEKILAQRGLKVGNISYQENLELLPNTVLAQYPRGGELVGLGQPVDLFVVQVGPKKPKEVLEN
jgi:beta-lactam-binding protein with PASTA domain